MRRNPIALLSLSMLALVLASTPTLSDVAIVPGLDPRPGQIIVHFGPVGPDPHIQSWVPVLDIDSSYRLNPGGDAAGDMAPSIAVGVPSGTMAPTFVWARQTAAGNHDPVYARFVDGHWTAPVAICTSTGDDLDPQLWQDAEGTLHAVWWRSGPGGEGGSVLYAAKAPGAGGFSAEEMVSQPAEKARTPVMRVLPDGEILVVYETDPVGGGPRTVVAASKASPISAFQGVVIATTPAPDPAAPAVESATGHRWTTWIDSSSLVGYSVWTNGEWSLPQYEPCSGPEDADRVRAAVRSHVLGN